MKTRPVTILTDITVSEKKKKSHPFTWAKVHARMMQLKKRLPEPWGDALPIDSVNDTKMCFRLLLAVAVIPLGLCAIPIWIVLLVRLMSDAGQKSKKGGRK